MCDQNPSCFRAGQHPGVRHRFTPTAAEKRARISAQSAERTAHITKSDKTKIGRYTLKKGDAVRLRQAPGKKKWLGIFQALEINTKTGNQAAVVVGGKVGGACLTRSLNPDDLIYLRPGSRDAVQALVIVGVGR